MTMSMVRIKQTEPVRRESEISEPEYAVSFNQVFEQKLLRALNHIARLQAEVRTLREALARSERLVEQRDVLLQNALTRELELRATLAGEMC